MLIVCSSNGSSNSSSSSGNKSKTRNNKNKVWRISNTDMMIKVTVEIRWRERMNEK